MISLFDQTNYLVELQRYPKRIVSLVPSQSEYLWDLGLQEELIGITKFCIHPLKMFETVTRIGGTKQLKIEAIESLNPDLIIANKEENEQSQIEHLRKKYPVYTSDIITLEQSYQMMQDIGKLTNKEDVANTFISSTQKNLATIQHQITKKRVAYLIWKDPYMAAANETFIHTLLDFCGFENVASKCTRYPEVTLQQLMNWDLDYLFLSSEPFPFSEQHKQAIEKELNSILGKKPKLVLVNGEAFSWYGSRLSHFHHYFNQLLHHLMQ
jgi:ABC-type Fe3+-hydroxamate transport system substrate-binding protein